MGLSLYDRSLAESQKLDQMPATDSLRIYDSLSVLYFSQGDYPKYLATGVKTLTLARAIGDSSVVARALFDVGRAHYYIRNRNSNEISLKYLADALELATFLSDTSILCKAHRGIGAILGEYWQNEKRYSLDTSIYHLRLANEIAIARGDYYASSGILCVIGEYLMEEGDHGLRVEKYFQEALTNAEKADVQEGKAFAFQKLGYLYTLRKEYAQAEHFFENSLRLYRSIGSIDGAINTLSLMKKLYTSYGTKNQLAEIADLMHKYYDSLYNESTARSFAEMQTRFDTERKEQQIKILLAESQLHEARLLKNRFMIGSIIVLTLIILIAILIYNSRKRYKLKAEMSHEIQQLQKEQFNLIVDGQEKERKRIARELHDGLGQLLSTIHLSLSSMDVQNKQVNSSLHLMDQAISDVRNISHNMMPNALISSGLVPALEDMIHRINSSGKVRANFSSRVNLETDENIAVAIYRITQEVVNNTLKHSMATELSLNIESVDSKIQLNISDNGKGFETKGSKENDGLGLKNIHSRVDLLGGQIDIMSEPGEGTQFKIILPINGSTHSTPAG